MSVIPAGCGHGAGGGDDDDCGDGGGVALVGDRVGASPGVSVVP